MNKEFIKWLQEQKYGISISKLYAINLAWKVDNHGMWNWKDLIGDEIISF
jgi:hypothetical protein